jgi:lysophospholipid acyltransferase (LPLAT)-like uncharacterized protein
MNTDYYIDDEEVKARNETAATRLARMAHMMAPSDSRATGRSPGRNLFVRAVDALFAALRKYALPIHWLVIGVGAIVLFVYVRLVALTARLKSAGERSWPDPPAPSVLALWHSNAPSLLVAFAKRRPRSRSVIMIARDPRGDCLALLCRMLGFAVVRAGSTYKGWNALIDLAHELAQGSCVFITADGGGPARVAKVGAVALASAAGVPLVPLAADCSPAIREPHKWDAARNPIPFGSLTVSLGPGRSFERLADVSAIEHAQQWLEETLNALATKGVQAP